HRSGHYRFGCYRPLARARTRVTGIPLPRLGASRGPLGAVDSTACGTRPCEHRRGPGGALPIEQEPVQLKSRAREEPEVNLTSLIDVVLLLLIFFMVSTSFVREAEITLRLPEASASEPSEAPSDALEITVTESGAYLVNGRPLVNSERRTLRAAIERLIGE